MARIPQNELERLKRETDLAELVRASGVELKAHGKDLLGLCPFHDDKEPSLVVTPSKNLWNCLGACGEGGTVVDWVMRTQGVSFRHAVEILRADNPELSGEPAPPPKRSTVPKLPLPIDPKSTDTELLTQVAEYYHETLEQSPEALEYLDSRGLNSADVAARFKLGFANRTLGYRLPQKNRKDGQEIRARLQEIGVIRESGHASVPGSRTLEGCYISVKRLLTVC